MLDRSRSFIIEGAAGTGETHLIPAMVNYCLAIGKSVKVIADGNTLDGIEARCYDFIVADKGHKFLIGRAREANYIIFGSARDPRDNYPDHADEARSTTSFSS
ncbi:hypothetical protein [Ochrobactrum sp. EDr1-4]|uniref:hypothetical protein n=1 Tax=Ochrobactrum sp. EDr1-4 TaxID=3368622 RepID=UPI003B9E3FF7